MEKMSYKKFMDWWAAASPRERDAAIEEVGGGDRLYPYTKSLDAIFPLLYKMHHFLIRKYGDHIEIVIQKELMTY